jgi:tetratricopeptide (TPR) repeat protein
MPAYSTTYRDPLDSFTDREEILDLFKQFLYSARPGQFRLLTMKGNSGTGKTFLITYLTERICPELGWQSGKISFDQLTVPDFRSILTGFEDMFKGCVTRQSLKEYRDKRNEYNRRFDEDKAKIIVEQNATASGQSRLDGINQSVKIDEFRRRETQLRQELTTALKELSEECEHPFCFFIDGFERLNETDKELVGWLLVNTLPALAKATPYPLRVVTCGWEWPAVSAIGPYSRRAELADFDPEQVEKYLEKLEIIPPDSDSPLPEREELIAAFFELSQGHPLVLELAVAYFNELDNLERNAQSLRGDRPLIDRQVRVVFLEERLLSRLKEPYRTLLERGPILRIFDQATLQALLNASVQVEATGVNKLDDAAYDCFLKYPFVNREAASSSDPLMNQPIFHKLVRRVQLDALRRRPSDLMEQLNRKMADYYKEMVDKCMKDTSQIKHNEYLAQIPEKEFRARLEWLYHDLQVKARQGAAFKEWEELTDRLVTRWRRDQARPLLELVRQLVEEGEPFLNKTSDPYGQYLFWLSKFLEQEARWEEARKSLEEAVEIFQQTGNVMEHAKCLNEIGEIFYFQAEWKAALDYYQKALALREQIGNREDIAESLHNIGEIHYFQGEWGKALNYYQQALSLRKQIDKPADIAETLNNIGATYRQQGEIEQALSYYERALIEDKKVGNPADIASSYHNIGNIYRRQKKTEQALQYFEDALTLRREVGDPKYIASSLNSIGETYRQQENWEQALKYHEEALRLRKQVGNPYDTATSLNNIGIIYYFQGKLDDALSYLEQALTYLERVGDSVKLAKSLHNISKIYEKKGEVNLAIKRSLRALSLYEYLGAGFEADVADELETLTTYYTQLGEPEKSLSYESRAKQIREKLQASS